MKTTTIAGPFTKDNAESTMAALGSVNHSVFSIERKDPEGYGTDVYDYYVERLDDVLPDNIFGYPVNEFMAKQYTTKGSKQ